MGLTPEQTAAVGTIIAAVVVAGIRKVWVWGYQLKECQKDRDFWRDVALKSVGHTDLALTTAEALAKQQSDG